MNSKAILYKGVYLMPGSRALELYHESRKDPDKTKELNQHMKELQYNEDRLLERYK